MDVILRSKMPIATMEFEYRWKDFGLSFANKMILRKKKEILTLEIWNERFLEVPKYLEF